ncbi:UDP-3-O-acyl-N-acetylglucosamine deacetylase [Haematospirillum sp. 15-248]|uniref:UDP-3-O-acyl-N-acetylglucosamine deacetylase n=1 Tax=Haematospirillum sp. 15-248 TaxID=2723107 RepID=UPI001FD8330C|nr:UDP-3-O-acyl-N-acetylglucosamine deacetylase [Haematospirillum sp. 15-248]
MMFDGLADASVASHAVDTKRVSRRAGGQRTVSSSSLLRQRTLKSTISCTGIGLHSGIKTRITLAPAAPDTGIVFRRTDIAGSAAIIPANSDHVRDSRLCTVIGDNTGNTVATIEHLMAALVAMQVDNVEIQINGPEVPAMDGSAAPFVFLTECAGIVEQDAPRRAIRVLKPVNVSAHGAEASLHPGRGFSIDFTVDFPAAAIGRQSCSLDVTKTSFKAALSRARTFCLIEDLPKMRDMGLALGGSLDNAVVVNGADVLNDGGLRYGNEFARHKALDAIGDLALAGRPLLGHYSGLKSSHALNTGLVKALLADPSAWEEITMTEEDLTPNRAPLFAASA